MTSITQLVSKLGIANSCEPVPHPGKMQFGPIGERILPDALIEIYEIGDGIQFANYPGTMIAFEAASKMVRPAFKPSVYDAWPFFIDSQCPSSELAVIICGPALGYVIQHVHDGFDRVIAPDIPTFFDWLVSSPPDKYYFDDSEINWIYPRDLSESDQVALHELLAAVPLAADSYEGESLAVLAMSMMPDEDFVKAFGSELFGIENFRPVIWGRLQKIDSDAARAATKLYSDDYYSRIS